MQLQKAIRLFLGEYKPSTQQAYRIPLHAMRDWIGGRYALEQITPALLIEYFQVVKNKAYAAATEQKHAKSIKTFFNWCVRVELIAQSPARAIRARKPPREISRDKAMTDEELALLLDHLRHKTVPRDYALVLFLADTGARRGGAAGLRVADIDFGALTATVTEKGDKPRKVAFSEACSRAIIRWLAYRSERYRVRGVYVFSRDGSAVRAENLSLIIRRACQKVGIRTLSSHSLRHRKGHQFADNRIAPSIAATALGHEDPTITIQHYYPADWATAEAALRELMTPATPPKQVRFGDVF